MLIAVILPPWASLTLSAASTAYSQKGLITGGTPCGGTTLLAELSILKLAGGASGSITCLQQTIMFTVPVSPFVYSLLFNPGLEPN